MNTPTFQQQYDKIIQAYFRDEIKPMDEKFCFCGTLADGRRSWNNNHAEGEFAYSHNYTYREYKAMELPLLNTVFMETIGRTWMDEDGEFTISPITGRRGVAEREESTINDHPNYEDALFNGMCAALEVLKEIHRSRGENVDDVPVFEKRKLSKV